MFIFTVEVENFNDSPGPKQLIPLNYYLTNSIQLIHPTCYKNKIRKLYLYLEGNICFLRNVQRLNLYTP